MSVVTPSMVPCRSGGTGAATVPEALPVRALSMEPRSNRFTVEDGMNDAHRLALQVLQAINDRDYEAVAAAVTDDFVDHGAPPGIPPGREPYVRTLQFVAEVLQVRYEVHDVVADGDLVALRTTAHGTHTSGHLGFPATGRPYAMATMHLYRASDGLLAEHWGVRDELGALMQVGAIPVPELPGLPGLTPRRATVG
jgi:predicted ester cyclase